MANASNQWVNLKVSSQHIIPHTIISGEDTDKQTRTYGNYYGTKLNCQWWPINPMSVYLIPASWKHQTHKCSEITSTWTHDTLFMVVKQTTFNTHKCLKRKWKDFHFFIDFTHTTHMQIYLLAWYTFQIASCRTLPFKSVPNKDWMDAFSSNGSTPLSRFSLPPAMVTMEMAKQSRKSKSRETKVRDWRSHSHSQRRGYGSWQDRFQRN